jgi:hypothetical protein
VRPRRRSRELLRAVIAADERQIELSIPAGRQFHPTGRLVAGGLASRVGLDVDRMDDLRLAVESVLLQRPAAETLLLTMTESASDIHLRIGPFAPTAPGRPGLERVLATLVDDSSAQRTEHGDWIAIRVNRRRVSREGR